jgi:hypothetical protein
MTDVIDLEERRMLDSHAPVACALMEREGITLKLTRVALGAITSEDLIEARGLAHDSPWRVYLREHKQEVVWFLSRREPRRWAQLAAALLEEWHEATGTPRRVPE